MRKSAYFVQKVELCVNSLLLSHTQLHILLTFAYIFDICLLCTGSFPFPLRSGFFRSPLRLVQKIKQIPLADASGICIDFGGDGPDRTVSTECYFSADLRSSLSGIIPRFKPK